MKNAPFVRFLSITLTLSISLPAAYAHDPVYARKGIVVAQEPVAADVGVAVTHPFAGNIGGGGFMLIRLADGRTTFIDFREKAPHQATHDMYLDPSGNVTHDSLIGWRAVGVPGTVRGLELALKKYGTKSWSELLAPAIHLASSGARSS